MLSVSLFSHDFFFLKKKNAILSFMAFSFHASQRKSDSPCLMHTYRKMSEEGFLQEVFDKFVSELKEKAKEKERKRRDEKVYKLSCSLAPFLSCKFSQI